MPDSPSPIQQLASETEINPRELNVPHKPHHFMTRKTFVLMLTLLMLALGSVGGAYYVTQMERSSQNNQATQPPRVATATPTPTTNPSPTPLLKTYSNVKYGYTFEYPANLSLTGNPTSDYLTLANQITLNASPYSPESCRGDCPFISSDGEEKIGNFIFKKYKGRQGSIGGGTPQSFVDYVLEKDKTYYLFTVFELDFANTEPETREMKEVPEDKIALIRQILATFKFINSSPTQTPIDQVMCTMDAKICPDGSSVGRVPPTCEFAPCPN